MCQALFCIGEELAMLTDCGSALFRRPQSKYPYVPMLIRNNSFSGKGLPLTSQLLLLCISYDLDF